MDSTAIPPFDQRAEISRCRWTDRSPHAPPGSRVSSTVKAGSRHRAPREHQRARGRTTPIARSERVKATNRAFAGSRSIAWAMEHTEASLRTACRSSSTIVTRRPYATRPFISSSTAISTVTPRTARHDSARPPKPSPSRSTAVARCAHNRTGSSSAESSVTEIAAWDLNTPRPHQRRLAVTHRGVEHGERRPGVVVEHLEQARPAQDPWVDPRRHQLWLDHAKPRAIHRCR